MEKKRQRIAVVLPQGPTFDKIAALYLLWLAGFDFVNIDFESPEGDVPVGIYGVDLPTKYGQPGTEKENFGSATAWEAIKWGLTDLPGVRTLVELMDANNRTGDLKKLNWAMAWLVREIWEYGKLRDGEEFNENDLNTKLLRALGFNLGLIERDVEDDSAPFDAVMMARRFMEVPRIYHELVVAGNAARYNPAEAQAFVKEYFPRFGDNPNTHPLTLPGYLAGMYRLGHPEQEILDEGNFWLAVWDKVQDNQPRPGEAEAAIVDRVAVGNGWYLLVANTRNRRVTTEIITTHPEAAIVIGRHPRGHVGIMTSVKARVDLTAVYDIVNERERGYWHHERRYAAQMLLNGGASRGRKITAIPFEEIVQLVRKHAVIGKAKNGHAKTAPTTPGSAGYHSGDHVQGVVKAWDSDKGYGFIEVEGIGDVHVTAAALTSGVTFLVVGRRMEFDIHPATGKGKRPEAKKVRVIHEPTTPATPPAEPPQEELPVPPPPPQEETPPFDLPLAPPGHTAIDDLARASEKDLRRLSRIMEKFPPPPRAASVTPSAPVAPKEAKPETVTVEGKVFSWNHKEGFGMVKIPDRETVRVTAADVQRFLDKRCRLLLVGWTITMMINPTTNTVVGLANHKR